MPCCTLRVCCCTGPSSDPALGYDWAIVTSGPPAHRLLNGKCRTGDALGNYQGRHGVQGRGSRLLNVETSQSTQPLTLPSVLLRSAWRAAVQSIAKLWLKAVFCGAGDRPYSTAQHTTSQQTQYAMFIFMPTAAEGMDLNPVYCVCCDVLFRAVLCCADRRHAVQLCG